MPVFKMSGREIFFNAIRYLLNFILYSMLLIIWLVSQVVRFLQWGITKIGEFVNWMIKWLNTAKIKQTPKPAPAASASTP